MSKDTKEMLLGFGYMVLGAILMGFVWLTVEESRTAATPFACRPNVAIWLPYPYPSPDSNLVLMYAKDSPQTAYCKLAP